MQLPLDVWELIASHCRPKDALHLAQCCRRLRPLVKRFHSAQLVYGTPIPDAKCITLALSRFIGLTKLSIYADGKLSADSIAIIAMLKSLTALSIDGKEIGDSGAAILAGMTNLTELNVGFNANGDAGAASLAALVNLTEFDVSGNEIGSAGAASLCAPLRAFASLCGPDEPHVARD